MSDERPTATIVQGPRARRDPFRHLRDRPTFVAVSLAEMHDLLDAIKPLSTCPHDPNRYFEAKDEVIGIVTAWSLRLPIPDGSAPDGAA
jgi:hypothetical protein